MYRIAIVIGLAGCDVAFHVDHVDPDGPPLTCKAGTPFPTGTPVALAGDHSVEGARFSADQNTGYLALCPADGTKTGCDLYQSPWSETTHTFGQFIDMAISAPGFYDSYPTLTPDTQHLLFSSRRGGSTEIYLATAVDGIFAAEGVQPLAVAATNATTKFVASNEPTALGDGLTIYFSASYGSADGSNELFRSTGGPPAYGPLETLTSLSAPGNDNAPVVTDDELEIFFASDRASATSSFDALDIYTATRATKTDAFGDIQLVSSLSTPFTDYPLWISPNGCDLYYINKDGAQVATLYAAHR